MKYETKKRKKKNLFINRTHYKSLLTETGKSTLTQIVSETYNLCGKLLDILV